MPGRAVFGRDMLFNLMSIVYWRIVTTRNQRQVNIYNFQENVRRVSHEYAICYLVYVENTCIYRKSDYNNLHTWYRSSPEGRYEIMNKYKMASNTL